MLGVQVVVKLSVIYVCNEVATCVLNRVCRGGINSKVASSVKIDKGIGGHQATVARLAAMVAEDTKGSSRKQEEAERVREREDRQRHRKREETETGTEEKRRKVDSRRADEKSTEAHSEITWQQNIARRTAQGSPRI